jgi:hypothetical protein
MGCKQATIKSPSVVFATSPPLPNSSSPLPNVPIYVKSALKQSRVNTKGKTEKLSFLKRKQPSLNKSVNFDEQVRVKLRTPTPKETRYENTSSEKIETKQTPNNHDNDDDDDDQVSSISSQEDILIEQNKSPPVPSIPNLPLQRHQPNGFWHKNSSVAVISSINNIKEKDQLPVSLPTEAPEILPGNRFRVRRKVASSALSQASNSVDLNQSSPSYRSPVQSSPLPVQRWLPNTNAVLIEHRLPSHNDGSSNQSAYYAFSRRPVDKTTSTEK